MHQHKLFHSAQCHGVSQQKSHCIWRNSHNSPNSTQLPYIPQFSTCSFHISSWVALKFSTQLWQHATRATSQSILITHVQRRPCCICRVHFVQTWFASSFLKEILRFLDQDFHTRLSAESSGEIIIVENISLMVHLPKYIPNDFCLSFKTPPYKCYS